MLRYVLSLFLITFPSYTLAAPVPQHWAIYYTDKPPPDTSHSFNLIIFDSDFHPPLAPLKAAHVSLIGYVSLGEAEHYRSYYEDIESMHILLRDNPVWPGRRIVDVRRPEWTAYVLDKLIPHVLSQGFDGIMIDTMDGLITLEDTDPQRYAGMTQAAVRLIKSIRTRYPHITLILLRGLPIVPQLARTVDMVVADNTCTTWSPRTTPTLIPPKDRKHYVDLLQAAIAQAPALQIYTIDYWPPADTQGIKNIYMMQRAAGFVPYVATPDLQTLFTEPR